jgi:hypothetical protein
MTKLEEIALALFRAVTSDPEASWESMSAEEREDALGWARAGLEAVRQPGEVALAAGERNIYDGGPGYRESRANQAIDCWEDMIDELLAERNEGATAAKKAWCPCPRCGGVTRNEVAAGAIQCFDCGQYL